MGKYKYVTPSWIDTYEKTEAEEGPLYTLTSITTVFDVLNDNETETNITVYFYNTAGQEHTSLRITDKKLPPYSTHFFRISDLIEKAIPNYRNESNHRSGWLKIIASDKLAVCGKTTEKIQGTKAIITETCWSIPFFESPLEPIGKVFEPIDTGKEPISKIPPRFPRPFPK